MKYFAMLLVFSFSYYANMNGQHTFSIVAVDTATGEIGSAGATCLATECGAQDISAIVLGTGAIHTQSFWDPMNQLNATERMELGDSPEEIKDWLLANDVTNDPSARQYLMVDLNDGNPRSAHFTGTNCFNEFISLVGPNYAIGGNILISEAVVLDMETAFLNESGTLADKLIAAMNAAKRPGADARCLNLGISSASAFIRVAAPTDTDASYGNLSLDLNVWIGTDNFEPIDSLTTRYNETILTNVSIPEKLQKITFFPNPVSNQQLTIRGNGSLIRKVKIYSWNGKLADDIMFENPLEAFQFDDLKSLGKGIFLFSVELENGTIFHEKIMMH